MDMGVTQPRHQGAAGQIEGGGLSGFEGPVAHFLDTGADYQHVVTREYPSPNRI